MHSKIYCFFFLIFLSISCSEKKETALLEKPEENRFTKITLTEGMDEPMTMDFLPDNKILIVERKGGVKIFDEKTGQMTLVATIAVNTKYKNKEGRVREAEEGLMGVIVDPNYNDNHWVYLYYAHPEEHKHVLVRWELRNNDLIEATKKTILEVATQREECCHTGGGMVFDEQGNLFLTVGNNTVNPRSGASNLDQRPGHESSDDQRSGGNTNDLRGKILRIHPENDGTYTIPEGNLFPEGTENTRPEIYTMGHRNPWRPTLDSETGYLYWGEVGPDANIDSIWGTKGYDEFNQAKGPGFFGWPFFIADNRPYNSYDAVTNTYGAPFDPEKPMNTSVNNTGLQELPKPIPAFIYYPYGPSEKFPLVGSSGRSATGGPVFRKADFKNAERPFPSYYEGKWLIIDFMRDWIMAVTMDKEGNYKEMERFLPSETFSSAIDMDFGPSGDLYVLEYGDAWFRKNANSKLVKLEYNGGNRKPRVMASADKKAGSVPLSVQLTSKGTIDHDSYDTNLKYEWEVTSENGEAKTFKEPNPKMDLEKEGLYQVSLTVTDSQKESNKATFEIVVGNESPVVSIDFKGANQTFYFEDKNIPYEVSINDKEDGSTGEGNIKAEETAITFDYIPPGYDPIEVAQNQVGAELLAVDAIAKNLIESNDCKSCHQYHEPSIGPSYADVSKKYPNNKENQSLLVSHIINGSSGIWGEHAMAAHPELSEADAQRMVQYIMALLDEKPTVEQLQLAGDLHPILPKGEDGSGVYLLRAAYEDKGANGLKPLSGEAIIALQNPVIFPQMANYKDNTQLLTTPMTNFFLLGPEAVVGYSNIDMTGIKYINVFAQASTRSNALGGIVEMRLDSPQGTVLGVSKTVDPVTPDFRGFGGPRPTTPEEIKASRRMGSAQLSFSIGAIKGKHDIYFIFKNPEAKANNIIMTLKEIEFYNTPLENMGQ